jgi:hypothetical protein
MALQKITKVKNLNKGTSRDEWGNLNFWGYKTPDGMVRARVFAPDDDGYSLLDVRQYVKAPGSWYRRITFDQAIAIGSAVVKVPDTTKGFTSDQAMDEVNSIIEIHNGLFEKHSGRVVLVRSGRGVQAEIYSDPPQTVSGVSFSIASNDIMDVSLRSSSHTLIASDSLVKDYTNDMAKDKFDTKMAELRDSLIKGGLFLDLVQEAYDSGSEAKRTTVNSWESEGAIASGHANAIIAAANLLTNTSGTSS